MVSPDYENPVEESTYDFSTALDALKNGHKVTRAGWNGSSMYLELQEPDEHSKMTLPYIYICIPLYKCNEGEDPEIESFNSVPFVASQTDLLSEDWIIFN